MPDELVTEYDNASGQGVVEVVSKGCPWWAAYMAWHQDDTGEDGEPSDEVIESPGLMARLSVAGHHTARTLKEDQPQRQVTKARSRKMQASQHRQTVIECTVDDVALSDVRVDKRGKSERLP
jgi:hypothetical protein